jgi:hypothetical protein
MKRERARFGLDIVKELQGIAGIDVVIDRTDFVDVSYTDDKLIELARKSKSSLYTTDFNLLKVAEVEGVKVLNVNELAQRLKPTVLPGELMQVKIIQKGSGRGQGVGYAEDGTMIVVEQTDRAIGKTVEVVVDRMHNTLAGKMIFAKLNQPPEPRQAAPRRTAVAATVAAAVDPVATSKPVELSPVRPEATAPKSAPKPKFAGRQGSRSFRGRNTRPEQPHTPVPGNATEEGYVADLRRELL